MERSKFQESRGGNNLPNNTLPWDKQNDKTKKIEGNNKKILPGKLEEVGAEADKNEEDTKKAIDGNDANVEEAMEMEGNVAVGVGENNDVEENNANGVVDGEKNDEKISEGGANHSC